MATKADMYYDRTASPALRAALRPNGPFGYLPEFVRKHHLADLQLRAYPHESRCWATLYVGLTKVLDVYERDGLFWLEGRGDRWNEAWEERHPAAWFTDQPVASYVNDAVRGVADRFTNEGAVQAMLCTRASNLFSVVDREAVVGFANEATRKKVFHELRSPLVSACVPDPASPWFKVPSFGGELDLLAIDDVGRLLVIEIKPASSTSGIAWAPFQATFYARLFARWAKEVGAVAREILQSMLQQRVELGLTRDPLRPLQKPLEIVPVIAIGGPPKSKEALNRMRFVQATLLAGGVGDDALEVWEVEEAVRSRQLSAVGAPVEPGPWSC